MLASRALRVALLAGALCGVAQAPGADRLGLWHIVHDRCVTDFVARGNPAPCEAVSLDGGVAGGYAVLKDLVGVTQFLLLPTRRVTGIEDPTLLAPGAPNYFADAWSSIGVVVQRAGVLLPRDDLSLAVNSITARSQDQLHIHMDCVRVDVRDTLHQMAVGVGGSWAPLPRELAGHQYRAMRIDGEGLNGVDPFTLLAAGVPGAAAEMGRHTLIVVGMTFEGGTPGFILLDRRNDPARLDFGSGEQLLDHGCAVARR